MGLHHLLEPVAPADHGPVVPGLAAATQGIEALQRGGHDPVKIHAAFARARKLNFVLQFVFSLMSRKIMRMAKRRDASYSFLFVRSDGAQLQQIGDLLKAEQLKPVIDKVFPFAQAKEALEYLAQGRTKGKVVVQMR